MKRIAKYIAVLMVVVAVSSFRPPAGEAVQESPVSRYILNLYHTIDFRGVNLLDYNVFDKAMRGYLNLKKDGRLSASRNVISICDFSLPSTNYRLWVISLDSPKVLFNTYVAHGSGSGENYATEFSNQPDSHQSSLGFYITGDTYYGDHGTTLCLYGMDTTFNDAAFDRQIVVHGASYVSEQYICANDHLGRSWGCPAVPAALSDTIIGTLRDSTCLFVYYPDEYYLKNAYWLNKKVALPGIAIK